MKKIILVLLFALYANICALSGNITRTYTISFQPDDFSFTYDADGTLRITSSRLCGFPESNEPGLPVFSHEITLDGQYSYVSSKIRYGKRLIKSNVTVAQSPVPMITDGDAEAPVAAAITYPEKIYPDSNLSYITRSIWSDLSVFRFLVCPFIYDAGKKNLYFIESFSIDLTLSQDDVKSVRNRFGKIPSKLRKIHGQTAENGVDDNNGSSIDNNGADANVEYVIITADSLRQAFEPLMNWKRAKGLKSKIISVEEIYSAYPGSRNSLKLKNCLYDLYLNKGLVYVLLGGDDTIVPVQGCYCEVLKDPEDNTYYTDNSIPADNFYACFDGDFNWDGNGNGIYGELDDNINFTQYIYVTRVPIRTYTDVSAFISKLLKYEQDPDWSNRMLMCGNKLWRYIKNSTQSDAEAKGDNLYTNYIRPYWSGERFRFYDTATDFAGGDSYDLTNLNLAAQLSNGYDFVEMITHGGQTTWSMEKGGSYSSSYGRRQTNIRASIVTTTACHTNAFDTSNYPGRTDPCLSESLIRNPASGVIAYLGSSRYGWGSSGSDRNGGSAGLEYSLGYESTFYRLLFDKSYDNMNYGILVSAAKDVCIGYSDPYHAYRWLQFSLNPIGDPEMSIYIEQPGIFDNIIFNQTSESLTVKTGVEGCNICVMSAPDYGDSYHKLYDDIDGVSINQFPLPYCLCITKPGYIPVMYYLSYESESDKWIIQNQRLSGKNTYTLDNVEMGSGITEKLPAGEVEVNSGVTEINAESVILRPGFSVKKGAELKIKNR